MSSPKPNKPDMVFLTNKMDTFVELLQDPPGYFNRKPDPVLPESLDLKIISAALYLLVDCYLRGQGLKLHPRSITQERGMEALTTVWMAVTHEVAARPHMYPNLHGAFGRGAAAVDLDFMLEGFSLWSTEEDELEAAP